MSDEKKCPFCGAADPHLIGQSWYKCGTHTTDTEGIERGRKCLLNELAMVKAERDRLSRAQKGDETMKAAVKSLLKPRRYGLDVEHGEEYSDPDGPWVRVEDYDDLKLRYEEVCGERDELLKVLARVREYFDERADCDQPSGSAPIPNEEMTLLVAIDAVLADTVPAKGVKAMSSVRDPKDGTPIDEAIERMNSVPRSRAVCDALAAAAEAFGGDDEPEDVTEQIQVSLDWMAADMDFRRSQTGLDSDPLSPEMVMVHELLAEFKAGRIECIRREE